MSDHPDRAELIRAREDLKVQLQRVISPVMSRDRNPMLAERLRRMIAEINELLAEDAPDHA